MAKGADRLNFDVEVANWRLRAGSSWELLSRMIARNNRDQADEEVDDSINGQLIDFEKVKALLSKLQKKSNVHLSQMRKSHLRLDEEGLFLSSAAGTCPRDYQNLGAIQLLNLNPWVQLELDIRGDLVVAQTLVRKVRTRIDSLKVEIAGLNDRANDPQKAARHLRLLLLKRTLAVVWRMNGNLMLKSSKEPAEIERAKKEMKWADAELLCDQILGGSMDKRAREFTASDDVI